jgi:hypothetical protein
MELFGYSKETLSDEGLLALKEESFAASAEELRKVAQFLVETAEKIEQGSMKTNNLHLPARTTAPQVIVLNARPSAFARNED